jgi:hypothetical protein
MPSEELLVSDCEILIPAATENVITSRNADQIKAKIVVEGANGPTTAVADEILAEKRIFIVPDILANAGGVTASYFEWVQDRQGYFWKEAIVNEQLETILRDSFDDVVRYAEAHNVNNRIAAYMLAIDRVAFTIRQRGIYAKVWIVVIIIGREFLISGLRSVASSEGFTIQASELGKLKTVTQIVCVVSAILAHGWNQWQFGLLVVPVKWIAVAAIYFTVLVSAISAIDYFVSFWKQIDHASKDRRNSSVLAHRKKASTP